MAYSYKIHRQNYREGGYEALFDVLKDGKLFFGNYLLRVGDKPLELKDLAVFLDEHFKNNPLEEQPEVTESDPVVDLLVSKGLLQPGQTLDDLQSRGDILGQYGIIESKLEEI
jgi:hypothetical protein